MRGSGSCIYKWLGLDIIIMQYGMYNTSSLHESVAWLQDSKPNNLIHGTVLQNHSALVICILSKVLEWSVMI